MKLHIETSSEAAIVRPLEDIDPSNSSQFERALAARVDEGTKCLIIDFSRVGYIESSGIGAIVRAHRRMKEISGEIVLAGCNENLQKIFKLINFHRYFRMVQTAAEVIALLRGPKA
ncbi:MAG: STAS domain-containing protein [Candidatus Ozemobacteraceae bacterium]